jgi:hypothetical protein
MADCTRFKEIMMKIANKRVAVTPFESTSTTITVARGMTIIKQRAELSKLLVVKDSVDGEYLKGMSIFVRGEVCKHQLAREVFEEGGECFILIPYEFVVAVDGK